MSTVELGCIGWVQGSVVAAVDVYSRAGLYRWGPGVSSGGGGCLQ